jgi:hypothetical protein
MCFSQSGSLIVGLTGISFSLYLLQNRYSNKAIYAAIGIIYFSCMEILQFFQYQVIDDCTVYNQGLTLLGYLHICFQPFFVNVWLFAFARNPPFVFLYLSLAAGLLLASRVLWVSDDELCDEKHEPLCGPITCSFSGERHIAWSVRLRAPGTFWFTPSIGLHFFMWMTPALVLFQIKPLLALLLTGPYLAGLTHNIHEQPAIWCYTAIAQMIVTYFLLR